MFKVKKCELDSFFCFHMYAIHQISEQALSLAPVFLMRAKYIVHGVSFHETGGHRTRRKTNFQRFALIRVV